MQRPAPSLVLSRAPDLLLSWPHSLASFPLSSWTQVCAPAAPCPFSSRGLPALLFGSAGPYLGGEVMYSLGRASSLHPRVMAVALVSGCREERSGHPGPSALGSGHFKMLPVRGWPGCQLAALKEGSKEAKVPGPASIWTSWSALPCALITSPLAGHLVTYRLPPCVNSAP